MNTKCTCNWCQKFSPLCEKILFLLDNEDEKKLFDEMISNLMNAETNAVYWKEKYYGTWPSDGIDEILHHIDGLQKRIEQIKNENQ
jgi:hypothetical protein